MGLYEEQVLPRVIDRVLDTRQCQRLRAQVTAGLSGEVLEIGFGSGLNLPYLPPGVERVLAVDPARVGQRLSAGRLRDARVRVDFVGLDSQRLPLADHSVDAVLSTWTLCTIPDVHRALCEVRRVLRPFGKLHFLEHGRAPDAHVARLQRLLTPLQMRVGGGCRLARDIPALLSSAGLAVQRLESFYMPKTPKVMGFMYLGAATAS